MDLPKRKPNRIPHFDYSSPGAYFITVCVQDRKCILGSIVGGGDLDAPQVALTYIGQIVQRNIDSASSGTSRSPSPTNAVVPHFVSTFKRFCHRDVGEKIFQRSYHDHVIRGEKDYLKIWEYIDNNPARWKEDCFYEETCE